MTPQTTDQAPDIASCSLPPCLADVLPPLLQALDAEKASFDQAKGEILALNTRIAEVETWISAARAEADEANAKCLSILKAKGSTPKDALKAKAKHLGALEDIETFKAVIADIQIEKAGFETNLAESAGAVHSCICAIEKGAIEALTQSLAESLPRELFMLIQLLIEHAESRRSAMFNARADLNTPLDYALSEVFKIISAAVPLDRHSLGMAAIAPSSRMPELSSLMKTPLQLKKLKEEQMRQGAAQ